MSNFQAELLYVLKFVSFILQKLLIWGWALVWGSFIIVQYLLTKHKLYVFSYLTYLVSTRQLSQYFAQKNSLTLNKFQGGTKKWGIRFYDNVHGSKPENYFNNTWIPGPNTHKTRRVSITTINLLILLISIIDFYSNNHRVFLIIL
jgi:hypothetical protein